MGRSIYSQKEIDHISHLLKKKCEGNRFQQKQVRHILRCEYEFNISEFGVQGQPYGPEELKESIRRGHIRILDDATIEAMKERRRLAKEKDAIAAAAAQNDNQ